MPRSFPTDHPPKFEEIRLGGIGLAAELVLKKKFNEAKHVLEKVLELSPDDIEIINMLASIYAVDGNLEKAEEWLDKVLSIKPDYPQALYNKGVVYHKKGEFEKAIEVYERAIEHHQEDEKKDIADAYQNLGFSLWEVRRREDALEAWRTSLKYNPKQKYAKRYLREFTNEYGLPKSPVGMDDLWAFVDFKQKEYFSVTGKDNFDDTDEFNVVIGKIKDAWNAQIAQKYGRKLDRMKTREKIKLFNGIKVFV